MKWRSFDLPVGDFIPKEKILQYEFPNRIFVKEKRPLSEVPQYYYNENQESNFSNVPDHYQNVGCYSTAIKWNFENLMLNHLTEKAMIASLFLLI